MLGSATFFFNFLEHSRLQVQLMWYFHRMALTKWKDKPTPAAKLW